MTCLRGISCYRLRIEVEGGIRFSERLMLGDASWTNQPSPVERLIEHQHQVLLLEYGDCCSRPVQNRGDVFCKENVEYGAHFSKRSRAISEFPNHAVHRIEGSAYFFWRP